MDVLGCEASKTMDFSESLAKMIHKGIKNRAEKLKMLLNDSRPRSIYQYFNLATMLSKRDLDTKKTTPNIEGCPESLRAMLEYCERGIFPNTGAG